jgi:hypothetical protein
MLDVWERAKEALRVVYEDPGADAASKIADLKDLAHEIEVYVEILARELPEFERDAVAD